MVSRTLIDIHLVSNQQLNFADPGTNLADEIGKFGNPHPDFQDNETSLTFMFNFSYLQSKDHGGRFVVPGLNVAIPLKSRSIIRFSARYLHFALPIIEYSVPENSPLRLPVSQLPPALEESDDGPYYNYSRCAIPVYTDLKMRYPEFGQFNLEIFSPEAALALFEDTEGHQSWMTNFYMVFEDEIKRQINISYVDSAENLFGTGRSFWLLPWQHILLPR